MVNGLGQAAGAALLCGLASAGGAEPVQMLGTAQMQREIFGVHLFGHEQNSGMLFDECIEPSGRTVYRTRTSEEATPYSEPGQLAITDTAQACFSYPPEGDPDPACFRVFQYGEGYIFDSLGSGHRFIATEVLRGVTSCPEPGLFLS